MEAITLCWTPLPYFFLCSGARSEHTQNYTEVSEIIPQILSSQFKILYVFFTGARKPEEVPLKQSLV